MPSPVFNRSRIAWVVGPSRSGLTVSWRARLFQVAALADGYQLVQARIGEVGLEAVSGSGVALSGRFRRRSLGNATSVRHSHSILPRGGQPVHIHPHQHHHQHVRVITRRARPAGPAPGMKTRTGVVAV